MSGAPGGAAEIALRHCPETSLKRAAFGPLSFVSWPGSTAIVAGGSGHIFFPDPAALP